MIISMLEKVNDERKFTIQGEFSTASVENCQFLISGMKSVYSNAYPEFFFRAKDIVGAHHLGRALCFRAAAPLKSATAWLKFLT